MAMDYRRKTVLASLAVAAVVLVIGIVAGAAQPAITFVIIMMTFTLLGLWFTRTRSSDTNISHAAAQALGDADVIIYWRPG